jgi:hypothetical protein
MSSSPLDIAPDPWFLEAQWHRSWIIVIDRQIGAATIAAVTSERDRQMARAGGQTKYCEGRLRSLNAQI